MSVAVWLSYLYVALFPYLITVSIVGLLYCNLIILAVILGILEISLLMLSMALCLIGSLRGNAGLRSNLAWVLAVKLVHLPAHILMVFITMGMMNPFLIVLAWLPLLLSFAMMSLSGTLSVGTVINSYRLKKIGIGILVLFIVFSYLYIVAIITLIIRLILGK